MPLRSIFISAILSISIFAIGQKPVTDLSKDSHLSMLKDGVLLVRLQDNKAKAAVLQKRGQNNQAETLLKETEAQNLMIIKAFQTHYTFSKVHFIRPADTKTIIKDKSIPLMDLASKESFTLEGVENVYVTDYGFGNPADGFERYNRKGFQIFYLNGAVLENLNKELFYAGVRRGFFSPKFSKNLQKTIIKMNRRFESGNKYL